MENPPLNKASDSKFTIRLRLEPVSPANAADLWLVHNDDDVSSWYDDHKPSFERAEEWATLMGDVDGRLVAIPWSSQVDRL